MRKIVFLLILLPHLLLSQEALKDDSIQYHNKMEWFNDAKLGIFIHWGIYAVNGISESWSFFNGYISHQDYLKQADKFTAKNYDPAYWAKLIKTSGAKYAVITTKHHDGFALWNSKTNKFNSVKRSPAKNDLIKPFVRELRKNDIKVGLYYSLPDWTYEDYTHHTKKVLRYKIEEDSKRWAKFSKYNLAQLKELKDKFSPDLWWFDGDWEHSAEEWKVPKIKSLLTADNPGVIFNSRLQGHGDYETPEIGLPVYRPLAVYWELCMTMNDSWGYQHNDSNYKSPQQIIDIFVDCISKGGNLLLDIGPKEDGTIPEKQEQILRELGKWTSKHGEAIYHTRSGIPYEHFYGPTSLSKDSSILFLYVRDLPKDGKVAIKGIQNKINRAYVVGNGTILNHQTYCKPYWSEYPGLVYIDLPESALDEYYTVVALILDGKIKLYKEKEK